MRPVLDFSDNKHNAPHGPWQGYGRGKDTVQTCISLSVFAIYDRRDPKWPNFTAMHATEGNVVTPFYPCTAVRARLVLTCSTAGHFIFSRGAGAGKPKPRFIFGEQNPQ